MNHDYINLLEDGISTLPKETQEALYMRCAVNCVKDGVLLEQKRQAEECNGDMDEIYTRYANTEYYFRKIIEPGHIYEMGYPRCLCSLVADGLVNNACHCECSRQSIIYILNELNPDETFTVEKIETVLEGAESCRFRITIENEK